MSDLASGLRSKILLDRRFALLRRAAVHQPATAGEERFGGANALKLSER